MSAEAIRKAWSRVREKAGLPKLLFRDLRHVAPTSYAREGMNAFQIRDILGHKTTNQGKMCCGRTPMQTLMEGKEEWGRKVTDLNSAI